MADLSDVKALLSELERFEGRVGSFRIGTDDNEIVLSALRIAARVLDEGFGAILQAHIEAAMDSAIPEPWDVSRHHTQAVINYLKTGEKHPK